MSENTDSVTILCMLINAPMLLIVLVNPPAPFAGFASPAFAPILHPVPALAVPHQSHVQC